MEPAGSTEQYLDDAATLRAARRGDAVAGRELVARHGESMMRTACSILGRYAGSDAQDVVQDALVAALVTPALPEGDVGAWLRAISARKALDWVRRASRRAEVALPEHPVLVAHPAATPETIAVRNALVRLSALDRAVLTLVDLEGFSMAEAASAIGSTSMAVKWRAVRARRKLRALLEASA